MKKKVNIFLFISFFSFCCSENKKESKIIDCVITIGQSYKFDFKNKIYTVYGTRHYDSSRKIYIVSGTPMNIKMKLSAVEFMKIQKKFFDLEIDEIPNKAVIQTCCITALSLPHYRIFVNTKDEAKELRIDDISCNKYCPSDIYAKKVQEFIKFCLAIVEAKPEIKNAPKSYLLSMLLNVELGLAS